MLPAVVLSTFAFLLCLLSVTIIIPLCNFVFWNETKDTIINFSYIWLHLDLSESKEMMLILWITSAISTGSYGFSFLYLINWMPIILLLFSSFFQFSHLLLFLRRLIFIVQTDKIRK